MYMYIKLESSAFYICTSRTCRKREKGKKESMKEEEKNRI